MKFLLKNVTRGNVKLKELIAKHTSFGIGGPAEVWIEPLDVEDLTGLITFLKKENLPWIILGNGTNVLVGDSGFSGVVINLKNLASLSVEDNVIAAGAGVSLPKILDAALNMELEGFEFAAGIPGTIGGAVVTNAGGKNGDIGNVIEEITIVAVCTGSESGTSDGQSYSETIPNVDIRALSRSGLKFTYRDCSLPPGTIVVETKIGLKKGKKENIKKKIAEILEYRKLTQPLNSKSAGCIFKNPEGKSAGKLIESAGLAGKRIGDAEISTRHVNFIVNRGKATASDVISLIEVVEAEVLRQYGIKLDREIKVIEN